MKSLEIVNEHIKFIDDHRDIIKGTPVMLTELEQIKQDLEALEIIKNKKVDMTFFVVAIHSTLPIDEQINYYNSRQCNYCKLTDEEFKKLKQWLEENEE